MSIGPRDSNADEIVVTAYGPRRSGGLVRAERREHIFADESNTAGRFMVAGGVWLSPACETIMRERIGQICADPTLRHVGEFKWTKSSGSVVRPSYTGLVDAFFAESGCRFNAIVIDRHNPGQQWGDDDELDLYKALHWVIRKRIDPRCDYHIVLDERSNRRGQDRLGDLLSVLNTVARKDHTALNRDCIREVIPRSSHDDVLLQLSDVLIGSIAYHINGNHERADASPAKQMMARYIAGKAGFTTGVIAPTGPAAAKFNVWKFEPTTRRKR